MYKGTLAMVGPWEALVTFQQFVILADRDGVVDMTAQAISRETTIPIRIINKGIEALEQPDPESRTPTEDGRRIVRLSESRSWGWKVTNYEYYRKLRSEDERREYHRQYWREKRSKTAKLNTLNGSQQTQPMAVSSKQYADAESTEEKRQTRATRADSRLPDEFDLSDERRAYAVAENLDADRTFAQFSDYWRSVGGSRGLKRNWDAAWRYWCRNQVTRSNGNGGSKYPPFVAPD